MSDNCPYIFWGSCYFRLPSSRSLTLLTAPQPYRGATVPSLSPHVESDSRPRSSVSGIRPTALSEIRTKRAGSTAPSHDSRGNRGNSPHNGICEDGRIPEDWV